jgi:hypothetical protein
LHCILDILISLTSILEARNVTQDVARACSVRIVVYVQKVFFSLANHRVYYLQVMGGSILVDWPTVGSGVTLLLRHHYGGVCPSWSGDEIPTEFDVIFKCPVRIKLSIVFTYRIVQVVQGVMSTSRTLNVYYHPKPHLLH